MAEIKAHEFDGFLSRDMSGHRLFLVYGPDRGLVSERAASLAARTKVNLNDPFSVTKFDASDLARDAGSLLDEAYSIGLFGGAKIIWIRGANNEKPLIDALVRIAADPPPDTFILIEGGDLKKGSGLRKAAESTRFVMSIPCYGDDARALNGLIDQELAAESLRIEPAARDRLISLLGGDRIASRMEIRKLALYCRGFEIVTETHVADIIGDASAVSTDDAVDAVLKGNTDDLVQAMNKIASSKTPVFLVLQACLKQFQLLDQMRAEMDEKKLQATQVMQTLGRHLHFRRKPLIEQALRHWTPSAISREMNRLQDTILKSRERQALEDTIALQTLLSITLQSARRA